MREILRNAPTTGDVPKKRHHLLRTLRAAEGDQQDCLIWGKRIAWLPR